MATGGEDKDQLTPKQIVRLASAISADNMASIAEGYLDISHETIKNKKYENKDSAEAFNRDILRHWMYRNPKKQNTELAELLYEAAQDCSYVDSKKIEDILGVSQAAVGPSCKRFKESGVLGVSQEHSSNIKTPTVSEEELLTLAGDLRPWTERAMKIEVALWIKEYVADMDDLYCELILEKLHNKPTGLFRKRIENYAELFIFLEHEGDLSKSSTVPCKKILIKADPGMGKTTLVKKIAFDWAKMLFTNVTIVFFVFLKLVKPGDTIENVIINQTPELEGLGITPEKLKSVLEYCGTKILIILDGLDEHAFGKNQDVLEIVKHKKYLFCNVLLTSRPHSTSDIERYFDTIVSVEGFTQSEARKFALTIVPNANKVGDILKFNPTGLREKISLYNCPILLSFLCILVRENDIDLSSRAIFTGELYIRMVCCLYKKYCIRKGITFEHRKFTAVLRLIGHLALETLLSGNPLMNRSDIIREVGDDAFAYGLLIGHEDFRVIRDETADILITFAHRSIQEFLGLFGFIQKLNDGQNIMILLGDGCHVFRSNSLLGAGCSEPIFMVNPLFLHFCLWLLCRSEQYLSLPNREKVSKTLESVTITRIDQQQLHISDIVRVYPAIDFERAVNEDNELSMQFFGRVLKGIRMVKNLTLRTEDPLEWILAHISGAFKNLTVLRVCGKTYESAVHGVTFDGSYRETLTMTLPQFTSERHRSKMTFGGLGQERLAMTFNDEYLNIVLTDEIYRSGKLEEVLKYCCFSRRRPAVYLYLQDGEETDLTNVLYEKVFQAHVLSTKPCKVTLKQDVKCCPNLSHLSLVGRVTLDRSVFIKLDKAVKSANLPQLSRLSLAGAMFVDNHQIFQIMSQWSSLSYLNLFGCVLCHSDIQTLCSLKQKSLVLSGVSILQPSSHDIKNRNENTSLREGAELLPKFLENHAKSIKDCIVFGAQLRELLIYDLTRSVFEHLIDALDNGQLCNLTTLRLFMTRLENCPLTNLKLDVTPLLESLGLQKCISNTDDLQHLSTIIRNCRKLHLLDISHSSGISGHLSVLMRGNFPYLRTLVLSDCGLNSDDLSSLAQAEVKCRLPQLEHLDISHNIEDLDCLFSFGCRWKNLLELNIRNYVGSQDYISCLCHNDKTRCLRSLECLKLYVDRAMKFQLDQNFRSWPWDGLTLKKLEIVSTLEDIEHALTYAKDVKTKYFSGLLTVCVVVKSSLPFDLEMNLPGDDWSDMYCAMHTSSEPRGEARNAPELDDKKFAEALYELKSLGVEVHVWFSGDEQFTEKAGVTGRRAVSTGVTSSNSPPLYPSYFHTVYKDPFTLSDSDSESENVL